MVDKIKCSICGEYKRKYSGSKCEKCVKTIRMSKAPKISCACGCGTIIPSITFDGIKRKYEVGHGIKGSKHYNYKGYRRQQKGYDQTKKADHPYADSEGYVYSHRLVYEQYLSIIYDEDIFLPKTSEIHHVNGKKGDNSLINLEKFDNHHDHMKIHKPIKFVDDKQYVRYEQKTVKQLSFVDKTKPIPKEDQYKLGYICKRCKDQNWIIDCACGRCEEHTFRRDKKGRLRFFVNFHNQNYKGGRYKHGGYWYIYIPDYFGSYINGYVREHIYNFQEYNKCCMLPWGDVHHVDENKDNNMPQWNLVGMLKSKHASLHFKKDTSE